MPDYIFLHNLTITQIITITQWATSLFQDRNTVYFSQFDLEFQISATKITYTHRHEMFTVCEELQRIDGRRTDASVFQFAIRARSASTLIYFRLSEKSEFWSGKHVSPAKRLKSLLVFNVDKVKLNF